MLLRVIFRLLDLISYYFRTPRIRFLSWKWTTGANPRNMERHNSTVIPLCLYSTPLLHQCSTPLRLHPHRTPLCLLPYTIPLQPTLVGTTTPLSPYTKVWAFGKTNIFLLNTKDNCHFEIVSFLKTKKMEFGMLWNAKKSFFYYSL